MSIAYDMFQESEDVAEGIRAESKGKIKTGVYNAKVDDAQRMKLHERWRRGEVQVVCATIGQTWLYV